MYSLVVFKNTLACKFEDGLGLRSGVLLEAISDIHKVRTKSEVNLEGKGGQPMTLWAA